MSSGPIHPVFAEGFGKSRGKFMNRETFRELFEIMGIVSIVGSLIFVGLQVRQNTTAVQSESISNLTTMTQNFLLAIASDPQLAHIWDVGLQDHTRLTEEELVQFRWLRISRTTRLTEAWMQWRRGTLTNDDYNFYRPFICNENDGLWETYKETQLPEYVAYVEAC